jgi:glycosyltransferase 2 family protein
MKRVSPKLQRLSQYMIGGAMTVGALFFALRGIEWRALILAFQAAHFTYALPMAVAIIGSYYFRALRWRILLSAVKRVSLRASFSTMMMGHMLNNVFPFRLGEFYRAHAIGRSQALSRSAAFGSIVLERLLDVGVLMIFAIVTSFFAPVPPWLRTGSIFLSGMAMAAVMLLVAVLHFEHQYLRCCDWLLRKAPTRGTARAFAAARSLPYGFALLRQPRRMVFSLFLTFAIWILIVLAMQIALRAFSIDVPVAAAFSFLVVTAVGSMLPAAPGHVGTFHLFTIFALAPFLVSREAAFSVSIFVHGVEYLPVTLIGFWYATRQHLSLRTVRAIAQAARV